MGHTYTQLLTHIIFSTKDRIPYLAPSARQGIFAYMAGMPLKIGCSEVTIDGVANHTHIFLRIPPVLPVAHAVNKIKASSSKWIHEERLLPRAFAWQIGYSAFSVSPSNAATTIRYIQNQEVHHRKVTFQEEIVAFLKKHGIEYDDRYLWS